MPIADAIAASSTLVRHRSIEAEIAFGRHRTVDEVIRAGLRLATKTDQPWSLRAAVGWPVLER